MAKVGLQNSLKYQINALNVSFFTTQLKEEKVKAKNVQIFLSRKISFSFKFSEILGPYSRFEPKVSVSQLFMAKY